jgi:hypothetical protein
MKFAFCKVAISPLRKENSDASEMVSQLLFGELIEIIEIQDNWTNIRTLSDNYEGWMDTKQFILISEKETRRWLDSQEVLLNQALPLQTPWGEQWITKGAYIAKSDSGDFAIGNYNFKINPKELIKVDDLTSFASSYLNTSYLWGGKSAFGIDCSGFTQIVFRAFDKNLPRDAYQQEEHGQDIAFEDSELGDLAFFTNVKGKIIHVGIILNDSKIIHASGWVRIDELRSDGIYKGDTSEKTHHLHSIKRI